MGIIYPPTLSIYIEVIFLHTETYIFFSNTWVGVISGIFAANLTFDKPDHRKWHRIFNLKVRKIQCIIKPLGGDLIMEYKYLITDIQAKTKVSITSLNAFKKKHQAFIDANSMRKQRKIYYNQAAMDLFVSYYCPDDAETKENARQSDKHAEEQTSKGENSHLEGTYTDKPQESQLEVLKAENAALKAQIDTLNEQLKNKEAERIELLRQNSILIYTLQQEKQEKMLLLPQPKKSLGERVKSFFHKEQVNQK